MRLGILGAGKIARKMAEALASKPKGCECYAVASRSLDKAIAFAKEHNIEKAYGSYEELVNDPQVDIIYVATPHSHHYAHTRLAVEHGKPCLVEKAFTANAREAKELLAFAEQRGVFVTEAIWTRYMPMSRKIKEIMDSGAIGEPKVLTATLCYKIDQVERLFKPELCGGALLDVGIYPITFARMYFGNDVIRTVSNVHYSDTGMDFHECISLSYRDGKMANLQAGALCQNDRQGIISGTKGYIRVDNINCPELIEVYQDFRKVAAYEKPADMINGYEYEVFECKRCIEEGLLESPLMPHAETIDVMCQMDKLREEWGVKYPMD